MKSQLSADEKFMSQALNLALSGLGMTNPNPLVGALIVKDGKIIGKGYHKKFGGDHAEIETFKSLKVDPKGATIYINLEPCAHHGKTPPCVDAIIKARITRVVCAISDPNPLINGRGIEKLKAAGIEVSLGVMSNQSTMLNLAYFNFHKNKRPHVAIKFASSLDGKLATRLGDSKWITNDQSREFARRLRGRYQAILVGANTVVADNPHLGTRSKNLKDPTRIILDSRLKTSLDSKVYRDENVIVITASKKLSKLKQFEDKGIKLIKFNQASISISAVLNKLKKLQIFSVLVEGGGESLGSFIDSQLVDEVYCFYAPILVGGADAVAIGGKGSAKIDDALKIKKTEIKNFGDNFLIHGLI